MNRRQVTTGLLLALGLAQMAAYLAGLPRVRGLAAATGASPAPKVFTSVAGLETFSTRFFLDWTEGDGTARSLPITPELYARLQGPYNRRNVYGAVLAFGPVLASNPATGPMFRTVLGRALCNPDGILRELGLDPRQMWNLTVRLEPIRPEALGSRPRRFQADCR